MTERLRATHCYIGTKACGCHVAIVVDLPDLPKETRKCVNEFMKDGYSVNRVTLEEGRQMVGPCKCRCLPRTNPLCGDLTKELDDGRDVRRGGCESRHQ